MLEYRRKGGAALPLDSSNCSSWKRQQRAPQTWIWVLHRSHGEETEGRQGETLATSRGGVSHHGEKDSLQGGLEGEGPHRPPRPQRWVRRRALPGLGGPPRALPVTLPSSFSRFLFDSNPSLGAGGLGNLQGKSAPRAGEGAGFGATGCTVTPEGPPLELEQEPRVPLSAPRSCTVGAGQHPRTRKGPAAARSDGGQVLGPTGVGAAGSGPHHQGSRKGSAQSHAPPSGLPVDSTSQIPEVSCRVPERRVHDSRSPRPWAPAPSPGPRSSGASGLQVPQARGLRHPDTWMSTGLLHLPSRIPSPARPRESLIRTPGPRAP